MSLKTWIKEFYPVPANTVPADQAAQHSLRKWIGARKENLERHGVFKGYDKSIWAEAEFEFNTDTCALCCHYYDIFGCDPCCPLIIVRGVQCDETTDRDNEDDKNSPFHSFSIAADPEPMIELLKQAVEMEKKNAAKS